MSRTRFVIPKVEDVKFYRRHGWWLSPAFLEDDVLDDLRFGIERYLAGERDWALPIKIATDGETKRVRQADYLSLQIEELQHVVRTPQIAAIAAALAETSAVRLFHDQLVIKPPQAQGASSIVGWHSDKAYWRSCSSANMITAWIPLDDVPIEKGPLAVWDGSHTWPDVDALHTFAADNLDDLERTFRNRGRVPQITLLPMQRGQVSFHHCRLVHGGYANTTLTPRYGYTIHLQDADNRFALSARQGGGYAAHINDLLCRRTEAGNPDYADPDICPQLWPPLPRP
jgi:ectoine hydroxylase-related dioxygenase (phytanoyl-CoA dioxygenase family)